LAPRHRHGVATPNPRVQQQFKGEQIRTVLQRVFFLFGEPASRAFCLKFIPEEFAFTGFARFQRQRLAIWVMTPLTFRNWGKTACSASAIRIT
jgi:hypothetical protein